MRGGACPKTWLRLWCSCCLWLCTEDFGGSRLPIVTYNTWTIGPENLWIAAVPDGKEFGPPPWPRSRILESRQCLGEIVAVILDPPLAGRHFWPCPGGVLQVFWGLLVVCLRSPGGLLVVVTGSHDRHRRRGALSPFI